MSSFLSFENKVLLKLVLGGVAGVAYFIIGHEHTQLNRVCYFRFFDVVIASEGSNIAELIYETCIVWAVSHGHRITP